MEGLSVSSKRDWTDAASQSLSSNGNLPFLKALFSRRRNTGNMGEWPNLSFWCSSWSSALRGVQLFGFSAPCSGSSVASHCPLLPRGPQLFEAFSSSALQLRAVALVWHQACRSFLVVPSSSRRSAPWLFSSVQWLLFGVRQSSTSSGSSALRGVQPFGSSAPCSSSCLAASSPLLPQGPQLFAALSSLALQLTFSFPAHLRLCSSPLALRLSRSPAHRSSPAIQITTSLWLSGSPRLFGSPAHLQPSSSLRLSSPPILQVTKAHQLFSSPRLFNFPAHHSSLAL